MLLDKENLLWILFITLMALISFNLYPEINKVPRKTFKNHPTPKLPKPQKVESWFKKEKVQEVEYEFVDSDKMEVAKKWKKIK